jgi:multidrug resistance efflux pump
MSASVRTWKGQAAWDRLRHRTISPIKLLIAIGCLAAAAWLLGPSLLFTESRQAVTNAPLSVVRTPIAGIVTTLRIEEGQTVSKGEPIALVTNDYWDPTAVLDIDNRLTDARRQFSEAHREAATIRAQQSVLLSQNDRWQTSMMAQIAMRRAQAADGVEAARARLDTAVGALARYGNLSKLGFVNLQRLDEVKLAAVTSAKDLQGARLTLGTLQLEAEALSEGVMLGAENRPPTAQRLDEIAVRLAQLDAREPAGAALVGELTEQKHERERQRERETHIELRAPAGGLVWRVFNAPGDRVASNSTLINMIDCSHTEVTAIFSQRDVDALRRGRRATVSVAGFPNALHGTIEDVNGYYDSDTHAAEAVTMRSIDKGSVLAHVRLDDHLPQCLVGVSATVRLD